MTQTTFDVDPTTVAAISELKEIFELRTNAQVIRKALALARVVTKHCNMDDKTLTIVSALDGKEIKILIAG